MTNKFVSNQEGMTTDWFNAVLKNAGMLGDARVEKAELEPVIGGVMTNMARARLSYSGPSQAPATILVKYPSNDEGSLGIAQAMGLYELEVLFYQDIAPQLHNLRLPQCYFAETDEATGRFILGLEDLSTSTMAGSSLDTLTRDQCSAVFQELANFQAPLWNSRELSKHSWLDNTSRLHAIFDAIPAGLDPFIARFGDALDPEYVRLFEKVLPHAGRWARTWSAPRVLQHGEFRSGNILLGTTPEAPPVTIIDFQTVRVGPPGIDPAYFMGASMPSEHRRKIETDIVKEYHQALLAAGVEDFDWDACWAAYRKGAMYGVFLLVGMAGQVEPSERNDQIILGLTQRLASMAIDLDAAAAANLA